MIAFDVIVRESREAMSVCHYDSTMMISLNLQLLVMLLLNHSVVQ